MRELNLIYGLLCVIYVLLVQCHRCLASSFDEDSSDFGLGGGVSSASDTSTESLSAGEEEEDSDEEDGSDAVESERKTGVVVAAVPVVLGLVTVLLLCVVMICRRNQRHKAKGSSRQPRLCITGSGESCRNSVNSDITNSMSYAETYHVEESTNQEVDFAPSSVVVISGRRVMSEDLPPSYEEVMRSELYRNCSISPRVHRPLPPAQNR